MQAKISIDNLGKIQRALRQIDKEAPKGLRTALNSGADLLIDETRPLIPRRTGAAAASLQARSTRTSARVQVGGRKAPYYPWLDFGGKTGINRSVDRKFFTEGRYLYPTLGRIRAKINKVLGDALTAVARNAGLDVS